MGFWVVITNRGNWWLTAEPTMSGGAPFRINKYMSSTRFEEIIGYLCYILQKDVGYCDGLLHIRKIEEAWNLNMYEEFNP